MADVLTTSNTLAGDLVPVYIKDRLLMLSERQLVMYQFGDKEDLPEGNGKTIQFTRYERLALPRTPATEGISPSAVPLTTAIVQAIVDQWIGTVKLSDIGIMTVKHPVLRIATDRSGTQHSETIDREIQTVLNGGTNVTFANGRTARSQLVAGDNISTDMLRGMIANLRAAGAPPFEGGFYAGVIDPFLEMDLNKDSTFANAAAYSNIEKLWNGEIGPKWMGARWTRSNFIPAISYLQTGSDTSSQFTSATNTSLPAGGTGFVATTGNLVWVVTKLDPQTGQETLISAAVTQTPAGSAWSLDITQTANSGAGDYNFYVSLQGSVVPVYQTTITLGPGAAAVVVRFVSGGTQTLTSTPPVVVVQGLGAVAPPAPPQVGTAGGPNVHVGYIFGREAFGVTGLGNLETFITPNVASDSDPAAQRRHISWKQLFKPVIKNPNFFQRFECLSAFN